MVLELAQDFYYKIYVNIVEALIMTASNDYKLFEHKVDKICHRLDMLEIKLLLLLSNRCIVRGVGNNNSSENTTCEFRIAYIGQYLVCERCGKNIRELIAFGIIEHISVE